MNIKLKLKQEKYDSFYLFISLFQIWMDLHLSLFQARKSSKQDRIGPLHQTSEKPMGQK